MNKYTLSLVAMIGFTILGVTHVLAGDVEKTVYVVENNHPVQRKLFVDPQGHYYRVEGGKHIVVEHVSENYPDKYFTRDGKQRPGVTIYF